MHFTELRPTRHYLDEHSHIPWFRVVEAIMACKSPRKKGDVYEIENGLYVLFRIEKGILWVINAK